MNITHSDTQLPKGQAIGSPATSISTQSVPPTRHRRSVRRTSILHPVPAHIGIRILTDRRSTSPMTLAIFAGAVRNRS